MAIDVEVGLVAMHALTHRVGHPSHGQNVARTVQGESILGVKPFARLDFLVNRRKTRIVCLKGMRMQGMKRCHPLDDIAGSRGSAIRNAGYWLTTTLS